MATFNLFNLTRNSAGSYTVGTPVTGNYTQLDVEDSILLGDSGSENLNQLGDISNDHFVTASISQPNLTGRAVYIGKTTNGNAFVAHLVDKTTNQPTAPFYLYASTSSTYTAGTTFTTTSAAFDLGASAPIFQAAVADGNALTLTYNKPLDAAHPPAASAFGVTVNSVANTVTAASINGSNLTLTLSTAVVAGQTVKLNYTDPSVGDDVNAIQGTNGQDAASLINLTVQNKSYVEQYFSNFYLTKNGNGSFTVQSKVATGFYIHDEQLGTDTASDNLTQLGDISSDQFKLIAANNSQLEGTYVGETSDGQSFVGKTTSSPAAGHSGYYLYSNKTYTNGQTFNVAAGAISLGDTTAPIFQSASVNGSNLILTYNEPLDADHPPAASQFTLTSSGGANSVTSLTISANTVNMSLATAVKSGQVLTVSYADVSGGNDTATTQDKIGNDAASFSNQSVTNNTLDVVPVLAGLTTTLAVDENTVNATPALIDGNVTFTDSDLVGGTITVSGLLAEDRVGLRTDATVSLSGSTVSIGATAIGTISGGTGAAFAIALNSSATDASVDTLIEHLTYQTTSDIPTASRILTIDVTDNIGVSSRQASFSTSPDGSTHFSGISSGSGNPVALGDINNDGRYDVVAGQDNGTLKVFVQDSSDNFAAPGTNPFAGVNVNKYSAPTFGDVDGDGDLDLVIGGGDGSAGNAPVLQTYIQGPGGTFAIAGTNPFAGLTLGNLPAPAFGDVTGDGLADLVLGGADGTLRTFVQNANHTFTEMTGASNPFNGVDIGSTSSPSFVDIDGDGDADLVVGSGSAIGGATNGSIHLFQQNADHSFTELTGAKNPFNGISAGAATAPVFRDVNGDGKADLIVSIPTGAIQTYLNTTASSAIVVTVTAQNDAPDLTVPLELSGLTNQPVVVSGISFSDVDANGGIETASFAATAGVFSATTSGNVTVANSGLSALTLTGNVADLNAFIIAGKLTISSPSNDTISAFIDDNGHSGGAALSSATKSIALNVNQPPIVANLNGDSATFTEDGVAVGLDHGTNATVTDGDSTDFAGGNLTAHISANGVASEDVLGLDATTVTLSNGSNINSIVSIDNTQIGTISSTGRNGDDLVVMLAAAATPANVEALIRALTYFNSNSADPSTAARTVAVSVNDGDGGTSALANVTVSVTAVNDAPTASIAQATYAATEQTTLDLKGQLSVGDPDGGTGGETVVLSVDDGALTVMAGNSGAGVSNSGTSSVTITGTLTQINALLNSDATSSVSYINNSDAPPASATLTLGVNDNGHTGGAALTGSATAVLNIAAVNDAPVIAGTVVGQTVNDSSNLLPFAAVSIADPDSGAMETITITTSAGGIASDANGTLSGAGLTQTGAGTYTLATATPSAVQAALRALIFTPTANQVTPGQDVTTQFKLSASDGVVAQPTTDSTTTVIAASVNDAPTIAGALANQAVNDNANGTPFSAVVVDDADVAQIQTVTITPDNPTYGELSNLGGGSYVANTGIYSFSGTAAAATAAIQGLVFTPTNNQIAPGTTETDGFKIEVNDGIAATVNATTTTVMITSVNDAPALTGAQAILPAGTEDTSYTVSAAALLTGYSDADVGSTLLLGVVSADHGSVSVANGTYTVAPTLNYNGLVTLTFGVTDGAASTPATQSFALAAVNDAPVNTVPASVAINSSGSGAITGLSIADVDAGQGTLTTTLGVQSGALTVATVVGGATITSSAATNATLTGTLAEINATLSGTNGVLYQGSQGSNDQLTVTTNDGGNTGGNAATDIDTVSITVAAVPPSGGGGSTSPTSGPDNLTAAAGGDTLAGGEGNDTINGGDGNDQLYGNQDNDLINGGAGDNSIYGGMGDDQISAGAGNDLLYGNSGADTISAGDGNNTVEGGQDSTDGADYITTGSGNDLVLGNGGNDTVSAGAGNDSVVGGAGNDVLLGNQGADIVYGNRGDDIVYGGAGDDTLVGGMGEDTLVGGLGNDVLYGNKGADLFVFGTNEGQDIVQDFSVSDGDKLALGGQTYTLGQDNDGLAVLTLSGGGMITLAGVAANQVGAGFFV